MFTVYLLVCIDSDPDGVNVPGITYRNHDILRWSTLKKRTSDIIEIEKSMEDSFGINVNFSWFLRCDHQINEVYGTYDWALREFNNIWGSLKKRGDDLCWHPHFWRWDQEKGTWYQELTDKKWLCECLDMGFVKINRWLGEIPAVRMGWGYHDNHTMSKLDQLGVKVDLSALPGLRSQGKILDGAFCDYYDWQKTTEKPFRPSKQDFRIPGKDNLSIMEIPMSVSRDPLPNTLYGKVVNKQFFKKIEKYPITPLKDTGKFFRIVRRYVRNIKKGNKPNYIGIYFHPTDLFNESNVKVFKDNLMPIPKIIKMEGGTPEFIKASEASDLVKKRVLK